MQNDNRGVSQNCGCSLARPYVNDQIFTKMFNPCGALQHGTLFPELYLWESLMYNKDLYSTPIIKRSGGKKQ